MTDTQPDYDDYGYDQDEICDKCCNEISMCECDE